MSKFLFPAFLVLSLALLLVLTLPGCGREEATLTPVAPAAWVEVAQADLAPAQRKQFASAIDARDAMGGQLVGALKAALVEQGPAGAIDVCRTEAPRIAAEVSEAKGVGIGRTSLRLRNAANLAPDWAKAFVEEERGENTFVAHEDGRLGALLPIRLQNACLTCHGEAAGLDAAVKERLAVHYPDDAATGFAQGDLRGWFWVEVPAPVE